MLIIFCRCVRNLSMLQFISAVTDNHVDADYFSYRDAKLNSVLLLTVNS